MKEIVELIKIRDYLLNITESLYMYKKDKMKELLKIRYVLDDRIIELIGSEGFKASIGYEEKVQDIMKEVRENSQVVKK